MKTPVLAANWKMNHGPHDAKAFMRTFLIRYARRPDRTVMIFPPALTLSTVAEAASGRPDILLGAQNIFWEDRGAFTGENSASAARAVGACSTLVGHSERRHIFGESDEETAKKCAAAVRAGLTPMLCVGERSDERDRGETTTVVERQLRAGVKELEPAQIARILIAYEPVWAIGTGRTATPEDASVVHGALRRVLAEVAPGKKQLIPILYGGSVNPGNASSLLAASDVDGLLVGGASLDPESWATIART